MNDSTSVEDRRKLLQAYSSRWYHGNRGKLWSLPVSNTRQIFRHGHVICVEASVVGAGMRDVRFVQLPSLSLGKPTKEWNLVGVPGLPLEIHPSSNLLVASQVTTQGT